MGSLVGPGPGNVRRRPGRDRSELGASYALVISIEAPEVDIDLYARIATALGGPVQIR